MGTAFKGTPVKLKGTLPAVGGTLQDFNLTKGDLSAAKLADFKGKTKILITVPSLDTGVCATETKRFNKEAAAVPGVAVLVVSRDLPFAQSRFCQAEGVDKVTTLSDLRDASFAERYGVAIGDGPLQGLMARMVVVADGNNKIRHVELVPEITKEPDYAAALAAAKK